MSTPTTARVPGHTLRLEGQAFRPDGSRSYASTIGRGKCSCGAMSDVLDSKNARKRWHREHKGEVIAAARRNDPDTDARLAQAEALLTAWCSAAEDGEPLGPLREQTLGWLG